MGAGVDPVNRGRALPRICAVSPGGALEEDSLHQRIILLYGAGLRMLVLREPTWEQPQWRSIVDKLRRSCPALHLFVHEKCAGLLADRAETSPLGIHLSGRYFEAFPDELSQIAAGRSFGLSCHDAFELQKAQRGAALYAFYSPIWRPSSKPSDERSPLGVAAYELQLEENLFPIYALGGVNASRIRDFRHPRTRVAILGELFLVSAAQALATFTEVDAHLRAIASA